MSYQEALDLCQESKYDHLLEKDEFRILQKKTGKEKKR
jgi:hypothetical protein